MLKIPPPILKLFIAFFKKDEAAAQNIMEDVFTFIKHYVSENISDHKLKQEVKKGMDQSKKQFVFL